MQASTMRPVSIDQLLQHKLLEIDIFLQLSKEKYVVVNKAGTLLDHNLLYKYQARGLQYLFVTAKDFLNLITLNLEVAGFSAVGLLSLPQIKISIIQNSMAEVFHEVRKMGMNAEITEHASLVSEAVISLASVNQNLATLVGQISAVGGKEDTHAFMTGMVAAMIGESIGWQQSTILEKLCLAGILHDVGKIKIPVDIAYKDFSIMSEDERVIYRSHVDFTNEFLVSIKNLSPDIPLIIGQHHEASDGSGWPRGLKDAQINPFAQVLILANAFVDQLKHFQKTLKGESAVQATITQLTADSEGKFNKNCIVALRRLAAVDQKKEAG